MPGRGCSREALAAVAVIMPRFSGPVCANAWQHVGRVDCRAFSAWQRAAGDDMAADEMPGVFPWQRAGLCGSPRFPFLPGSVQRGQHGRR